MSSLSAGVPFRNESDARAAAAEVVAHLRRDGLIAYPTETVYGLGGSTSSAAVAALRTLKLRSNEKSFLLLVSGSAMVDSLNLEWTAAARALAEEHWPGPLTLVIREAGSSEASRLPPGIAGAQGGVAIRWTSHPAVSELLAHFGQPITSTSANLPGSEPALEAAAVVRDYDAALRQKSLLLLDGGPLPASKPSTVVDCTQLVPRVLRFGALDINDLKATIPDLTGSE